MLQRPNSYKTSPLALFVFRFVFTQEIAFALQISLGQENERSEFVALTWTERKAFGPLLVVLIEHHPPPICMDIVLILHKPRT